MENTDGTLDPIFMYDRQTDAFHFYRDVHMHGHSITNVDGVVPYSPGVDKSFRFTKVLAINRNDGTCDWITHEYEARFNSYGQYIDCYKVDESTFKLTQWRRV